MHFTSEPRTTDGVVERHFALTKQWRGLATRFVKLAITYRAAIILAACITWTRIWET